ncbi:hypothetical protein AGMMS49982_00920 [Bacteroidia bacterium]|nr:hypothetical protein AGMMS49982_00920 [Bacteroidia bacterium]
MKTKFLLTIASLLLAANSFAQVAYTYNSAGAGKMTTIYLMRLGDDTVKVVKK